MYVQTLGGGNKQTNVKEGNNTSKKINKMQEKKKIIKEGVKTSEKTTMNGEKNMITSNKKKMMKKIEASDNIELYNDNIVCKGIRCMYFNADSLRRKLDELEIRSIDIDIIIVTESLPKHSYYKLQNCELQMKYFQRVDNFESGLCRRGICIFARNPINIEYIHINSDFAESILVKVKCGETTVAHILTIYRSPNSEHMNNTGLLSLIDMVCSGNQYPNLIIIGDFNYKGINWESLQGSNDTETNFIDCSMNNFLQQLCTDTTRVREGQTPSLLDLILVKDVNLVRDLCYQAHMGKSDHVTIVFTIDMQVDAIPYKPLSYKLNSGDYESIRENIGTVDWRDILKDQNVSDSCDVITLTIVSLTETYIPTASPNQQQKPIWSSKEATVSVHEKKKTFHAQLYVQSPENIQLHTQAKNKATSSVKKAKFSYEKKIADQAKTQPKSFWRYVNSKLKTTHTITELAFGDNIYSSPTDKANCMNNYFASVYTLDNASQSFPTTAPAEDEPAIENIIISREIIRQKLNSIKVDKSSGPDKILPRVLYECREELVEPLFILFHSSVKSGKLPSSWKDATVVPIFKKGSRKNPANYRPISLTSVLCKLLESIIRDQLLEFLLAHNKISDKQFGFLPGKSCAIQLLSVVNKWIEQLDEGNNLTVFYTDFSKAFDSVSHRKLIVKMKNVGITGLLLEWIIDFLTDRTQRVRIDGCLSQEVSVVSGVPQGSVLGPILFLIFIDDITLCPQTGDIVLFADDAKITWETNTAESVHTCQNEILELCQWSETWSLTFNSKKCKILELGNGTADHSLKMLEDNHLIEISKVDEEKDLGVHIDSNLNFRSHIGKIVKKANSMLGIIKRSFANMGSEVFIGLFKSLVRPHLEYSCPVWSPSAVHDIKLIEGVQRRGTKNLLGFEALTYEQRLRKLGLPTLEYRRLRADLIQVYRLFENIDHCPITKFFVLDTGGITRGNSRKLKKVRFNKTLKRNSFQHRVVNRWNGLNDSVVMATNLNAFKSALNIALKEEPIKFLPSFLK